MVESTGRKPVRVFRVLDREGRAIGEVVQPRSARVVGPGAGTVLLVRDRQDEIQRRTAGAGYTPAVA
jgi:hypothetical protein